MQASQLRHLDTTLICSAAARRRTNSMLVRYGPRSGCPEIFARKNINTRITIDAATHSRWNRRDNRAIKLARFYAEICSRPDRLVKAREEIRPSCAISWRPSATFANIDPISRRHVAKEIGCRRLKPVSSQIIPRRTPRRLFAAWRVIAFVLSRTFAVESCNLQRTEVAGSRKSFLQASERAASDAALSATRS